MRIDPRWLLIGLFAVIGCSGNKSAVFGGVDSEGEQAAKRYMERTYVKCGDSFYAKSSQGILEVKGLTWSVKKNSRELTEAEKLNRKATGVEIEWEGSIVNRCSAVRNFYNYNVGYWEAWGNCGDDGLGYQPMVKQNGVWLYYSTHGWNPLEKLEEPITCQRIPRG